jgi:hypothetical protein
MLGDKATSAAASFLFRALLGQANQASPRLSPMRPVRVKRALPVFYVQGIQRPGSAQHVVDCLRSRSVGEEGTTAIAHCPAHDSRVGGPPGEMVCSGAGGLCAAIRALTSRLGLPSGAAPHAGSCDRQARTAGLVSAWLRYAPSWPGALRLGPAHGAWGYAARRRWRSDARYGLCRTASMP